MIYSIKEIYYKNNSLISSLPTKRETPYNEIAIVAHVFYLDIWDEINNYLNQLDIDFDLFISVPEGTPEEKILKIFHKQPNINIFMTENRGRDVLPFLQIMDCIGPMNYKYICKIHTKKTGNSPLGSVWRKLLYFDLIGSNNIVNNIIETFQEHKDVGIITGKNTILDSKRYNYGNSENIDLLATKSGLLFDSYYQFPAGTMFWSRPEVILPLTQLYSNDELVFEQELGQKDDTLAHAVERFFGIVCQTNNQKIVESPSDYGQLNTQTLDELASLVLSQQYVGNDMFMSQKKYIQELEALTESMRVKNRLKRLFPSKIKTKISKSFKLFSIMKKNPQALKKTFYYLRKGDLKYLWSKIKEKSQQNLLESIHLTAINPRHYFKKFNISEYPEHLNCIDIIIPVYNGFEFLEKLFNSIEANTSSDYRLIVINDCSTDLRVKPYLLERLEKHHNALFIDQEINQGFLKSVNKAYASVTNNFVLLNTDTEVPNFWLERLMYPIVHMDNIASTTPFTNSGEIASFPNFVADNVIFDGLTVDQLDETFKTVNADLFYEEVPTGVGFCMGINYTLSKEIGMFDEDTFGKGYGEENDWCQRAIQKGYKNLIVPNLFVYHKHGGSFTADEKKELIKTNAIKLLDRHPHYDKDVHTYIQKDPHKLLRHILLLKATDCNRGTYLMFDHDLGGGANMYADEYIEQYVKSDKNTLLIRYDYYSKTFKIFHKYKDFSFAFKINSLPDLKEFLMSLNLKEIFLNNLVSYSNIFDMLNFILDLISKPEIKLIVPIHDYFSLSPSYNLLDTQGKYSISSATNNENMQNNMQEWRSFYQDEVNMEKWKSIWGKILTTSDKILCFSYSSKDIIKTVYTQLEDEIITVIPHKVNDISPLNIEKNITKSTHTIGVLGAINYVKGSHIIKQLIQLIEKESLNIHIVVIGELTEYINSKHLHVTGKYNRENLDEIIQNNQIDTFFIPSIWPETFSYTTQEIMMMELPLMVFDLGAPSERVKGYSKGTIIKDINAESVLETIKKLN